MREAEPRLSHHRRRHRADDQQPQTLRNADHAKAARYQCDQHRDYLKGTTSSSIKIKTLPNAPEANVMTPMNAIR